MKFGLMIIGDEILNGSHTDAHFNFVKKSLLQRGLQLAWVEYVADNLVEIVMRLKRSCNDSIPVFVTGGIGATPDDHTRQAAALAFESPLVMHPEAAELVNTVVASRLNETDLTSAVHQQRLEMARFPERAKIIPNPFNQVAGFSVDEYYFFPGFPVMAHPMMEWVLKTYYTDHFFKEEQKIISAMVYGLQESQIAPIMFMIEKQYAGIQTFSLPKLSVDHGRRFAIELGVKANGKYIENIQIAWDEMCRKTLALGAEIEAI